MSMKKLLLLSLILSAILIGHKPVKTVDASIIEAEIIGRPLYSTQIESEIEENNILIPKVAKIAPKAETKVEPKVDKYRIVTPTDITIRINKYRAKPLLESAVLNEQACRRAKYLVDNDVWSHEGYVEFFDIDFWIEGDTVHLGENLAKNFKGNHENMVTAWVNSPLHYKNIVDTSFTYHGWCNYEDHIVSVFAE